MQFATRSARCFGFILFGALVFPGALAFGQDNDNTALDPAAVGITSSAVQTHQDKDSPDAYPHPSVYPVSWELDVKPSDPKRIVVKLPGQLTPTAFWYVTYHVTNNSDQQANYDPDKYQDIIFYPHFEMRTNDGTVIKGDDGISPTVFDAIKAREGIKMLEPASQVGGRILIGEDHARDSVAIFPEPGLRMGGFSIFISGMWGETSPAKGLDGGILKDPKGEEIDLHKTMMLSYHVDGDDNPNHAVLRKTADEFIMR